MRKSIIGLVFLFALQASAQDFKKSYSITPSPPPDPSQIWRGGPMPSGPGRIMPPQFRPRPLSDIRVDIEYLKGVLRVEGYDGATVEVSVKKKGPQSNQIQVIDKSSDKLELKITYAPMEWSHSNSVDCEIKIPKKWYALELHSSGNIEIADLFGRIMLRTTEGTLLIRQVRGWLDAFSVKGSIKAEIPADMGQSINIASGVGNVEVTAPENLDARVSLSSGSGFLETNFPITVKKESRYRPEKKGEGTLGKGKPYLTIRIRSEYGRVKFNKK
jgi:hypothetical protein